MNPLADRPITQQPWTETSARQLIAELTELAALVGIPMDRLRSAMDRVSELGHSGSESLCTLVSEFALQASEASPVFALAYAKLEATRALRKEQLEGALAHAASVRRIALDAGWEFEASIACSMQGIVHQRRGEFALAKRSFEESVVSSRRAGAIDEECRALINLALLLKSSGRLREAESTLLEARDLSRSAGNPTRQAKCELNLSTVLFRLGRCAESAALADAAHSMFVERNLHALANTAQIAHARARHALGEIATARALLEPALAHARESGIPRNIVLALEFLAACDTSEGDFEAAHARLVEALVGARELGDRSDLVVECSRGMALAELATGNPDSALAYARTSVEAAEHLGDGGELAHSLLARGEVLLRTNQFESARADAARALQVSRETGELQAQAQAQSLQARLEQVQGEPEIAETRSSLTKTPFRDVPQVAGFLSTDSRVLRALGAAVTLAPQNLSILILGESGTGKELVAQAIHDRSGRKGPFVPVNCSAFPGDLIEGELFGHAKGAYTGADRERVGLFEYAHRGTLFLDEIGDMPIKAQARLLRALENGEVRRLGENASRTVDVRIVAATHRHLMEMVGAGQFRLDLYYRLAGFVVELTPVRERGQDAKLLIDHFLARFSREQLKSVTLSSDLRHELSIHSWPGNVREIRVVMQRLVSLTPSGAVVKELPFALEGTPRPRSLPEVLEAEERRRILDALQAHNWNKAKAAITLGTNRTTLIGKMKRMGISLTQS